MPYLAHNTTEYREITALRLKRWAAGMLDDDCWYARKKSGEEDVLRPLSRQLKSDKWQSTVFNTLKVMTKLCTNNTAFQTPTLLDL